MAFHMGSLFLKSINNASRWVNNDLPASNIELGGKYVSNDESYEDIIHNK